MENSSLPSVLGSLSVVSILLIVGMVAGRLAALIRVPDVVLFLLVGIAVGPQALNLLDITVDSPINQLALVFGAAYIVFDGGTTIRVNVLRRVFPTLILLATLAVLITLILVGYAAHWLLGIPLLSGLLLGALLAGTDPATLIPVFKQVRIRERVSQTVIGESAFNDATSAIAFFTILTAIAEGGWHVDTALWDLVRTAGGGLLIGILFGLLGTVLIAHRRYNFFLEYAPLLTVFVVIAAYGAAEHFHVSGFMAVFVAGICFGNINALPMVADPEMDLSIHRFIDVIALGMRMAIFILLGSHVNLEGVHHYLWVGLGLSLVLIFVARPLSVLACTLPDRRARWEWREILFLCWTRETGVIPAALSGMVLAMGLPHAEAMVSVTFVVILTTILLQATTASMAASRLGLLVKGPGIP